MTRTRVLVSESSGVIVVFHALHNAFPYVCWSVNTSEASHGALIKYCLGIQSRDQTNLLFMKRTEVNHGYFKKKTCFEWSHNIHIVNCLPDVQIVTNTGAGQSEKWNQWSLPEQAPRSIIEARQNICISSVWLVCCLTSHCTILKLLWADCE